MNLKTILLTLGLLIGSFLHAQNINTKQTQQLLTEAESYIDAGKLESALQISHKALKTYPSNVRDTLYIRINNKIANIHYLSRRLDSTFYYLNKVYDNISPKVKYTEAFAKIENLLAHSYKASGDLQKSVKHYEQALAIYLKVKGESHRKTMGSRYNLAATLVNLTLYNQSLDQLNEIIKYEEQYPQMVSESYSLLSTVYLKKNEIKKASHYRLLSHNKILKLNPRKSLDVAHSYLNLGVFYKDMGQYKKAQIAYFEAEEIYLALGEYNHQALAGTYFNLSNIFYLQISLDKSLVYLKQALKIFRTNFGEEHFYIGSIYDQMANLCEMKLNYKECIKNINKAMHIYKKSYGNQHPKIAVLYTKLGRVKVVLEEYKEALILFKKALNIYSNFKENDYENKNYLLGKIGRCYHRTGDFEKALFYHKKLIGTAPINFHERYRIHGLLLIAEDYIGLKKPDEALLYFNKFRSIVNYDELNDPFNFKQSKRIILIEEYFDVKSKYYTLKLKETGNEIYMDSIALNCDKYDALKEFTRNKNLLQNDKSLNVSRTKNSYDKSIGQLYDLKKEKYLRKAFSYAEKTKSRLLSESLNRIKVKKYKDVPDELLVTEEEIKSEISKLDKLKYQSILKQTASSDSTLITIEHQLFNLIKKQENLELNFKEKYPEYHNLKHEQHQTTIKEIQKLLQQDQTFIEYFKGRNAVYAFVINKDSYNVQKIGANSNLLDNISAFRNSIYDYESETETYFKTAYELFQLLIEPIQDDLQKKLIIVPDNSLSYIPFDALLTQKVNSFNGFNNLPYLLKKHQISYNYSAALFKQLKEKKNKPTAKNLIAFAPYFSSDTTTYSTITERRNGFTNLKYNIPEAKSIKSITDGELLEGPFASKINFLKKAKDYRIIHLATHAKANDLLGDYSFISFGPENDSIRDINQLYVRELYNLELNAEMAVLSACETGLGELKQGEGIISLARAFTYAGAKSTISSLWSVNDAQTKTLMENFYTNIKNGLPKDKALHKAKIDFLANENFNAPYYWAGFVAAGNMDPIVLESGFNFYWLLIILPILLGKIVLLKRKK